MPMLTRALARAQRLPAIRRPGIVRGDVRHLPFASGSMHVVVAAYGLLQSLLTPGDMNRLLREVARVLRPGGLFGAELVPDLPAWSEHGPRVQMAGKLPNGGRLELVESVEQDRRRRLTIFHEQFVERRGRVRHERRFTLVFRTEPMPRLLQRLVRAGFRTERLLGDYNGRPWRLDSPAWLLLARKP
jgi:SAM-dependent methyltransferase